jgi:hypothetical protein
VYLLYLHLNKRSPHLDVQLHLHIRWQHLKQFFVCLALSEVVDHADVIAHTVLQVLGDALGAHQVNGTFDLPVLGLLDPVLLR